MRFLDGCDCEDKFSEYDNDFYVDYRYENLWLIWRGVKIAKGVVERHKQWVDNWYLTCFFTHLAILESGHAPSMVAS